MARSSAAGPQPSLPPTKKSGGFTSGLISGWTKIVKAHGYPAEASDEARAEADSHSIAPAGHQAAADVDVGVGGSPQPGSRRESAARRGSDRGTAGRRS